MFVVVINKELNDKLFVGENLVGKMVYFDDVSYEVIGVIDDWDIIIKYYDLNNGVFNKIE